MKHVKAMLALFLAIVMTAAVLAAGAAVSAIPPRVSGTEKGKKSYGNERKKGTFDDNEFSSRLIVRGVRYEGALPCRHVGGGSRG